MVRIGRYTLDEFKLAKETHLDKQHFQARLNQLVTGQTKMVKPEAEAYLKGMYLWYSRPYESWGVFYPQKFVKATWTPSPNGSYWVD